MAILSGEPARPRLIASLIQPMLFISLGLVAAGNRAGRAALSRRGATDPLEQEQPAFFRFLENKMWLDELYDRTVLALARVRGAFFRLDGSLFLGWPCRAFGRTRPGVRHPDAKVSMSAGSMPGWTKRTGVARGLGRLSRARHSGQVQTYLGADRRRPARAPSFLRMAHLITGLILIPLLGALFVSVAPRNLRAALALGIHRHHRLFALVLWRNFDPSAAGLQLVERHAWIPAIGAEYLVGIDGLSLLLVLLTSLVFPFALLAQRRGRGLCALMLRDAGRALRHLHRAEFCSLVFVLRDEPDSRRSC